MWIIDALVCSGVTALYTLANQFFKLPASLMMLYRGILLALIISPLLFFIDPVANPLFYILCIIQGLNVGIGDNRLLHGSKTIGAEVSSTAQTLSVTSIFVIWLLVSPALLESYLKEPIALTLIVLCLLLITFAMKLMHPGRIPKQGRKTLILILTSATISGILNKQCMDLGESNLIGAVVWYCFIVSMVCGLANLPFCLKGDFKKQLLNRSHLAKGILLVITVLALMVSKNLAMADTPNPAYVSAVIYIFPLWIFLVGKSMIFKKNLAEVHISIKPLPLTLHIIGIIGLILITKS